ncbi:MAG: hypothetical protein ACRELY_16555 [Polyangiaceae bacterium]
MQRIHLTSFLFLISSLAACAPATSFQHVDVAYQPSANVHAREERLAPSAVTISDSDVDAIQKAGGVYLGELELRGERGELASQQNGPTNLRGRASLEAAQRGATHFMLLTGGAHIERHTSAGFTYSPQGPSPTVSSSSEQIVTARFALMRVEPDHWNELRAALRPDPMPQS